MPYALDDLIPVSALQHALFCERQYALIHLEQQWAENFFTAEGNVLHERVHVEHHESRERFRQEYDLAVRSLEYGIIGKCDLVEILFDSEKNVAKVTPIEFKRGKQKKDDVDRVQLCAQVLCLEEMFKIKIDTGEFYYLQEHRRCEQIIDDQLRNTTTALIERIIQMNTEGKTPKANYSKKKCDNCSLVDICMPKFLGVGSKDVARYVQTQIRINNNECCTETDDVVVVEGDNA
jgi:CRISPR-associated exonuclease Cas4